MVCVLLGAGFEESEALVPVDLLRRADVEVCLTSLTDTPTVRGGHGITVQADRPLSQVDPAEVELVLLPGGLGGVDAIKSCPAALELVRAVHARGGMLAAICAAPTILASLGLLEGRRAVCYPDMENEMVGAQVAVGSPVVLDGTILTAEAAGSSFLFGVKLVELLKGASAAETVKHAIHYRG